MVLFFLVHVKSEFQVGATQLLKANFLVLVFAKCTYSLCSEFLVLSSLVVVKKSSNFKSSIPLIILNGLNKVTSISSIL